MTPIEREALPSEILARLAETDKRPVVAIAGPPGAGKSTISDYLLHAINKGGETPSIVVPMDGFHLDDGILDQRGLLSRKGSPPTFDCAGFAVLLQRLKQAEGEIFIPVFDRSLELSALRHPWSARSIACFWSKAIICCSISNHGCSLHLFST